MAAGPRERRAPTEQARQRASAGEAAVVTRAAPGIPERYRAFGWALANWIADAACLVCAIKAIGDTVPWTAILIIWTAGIGAASLSPVPTGLGIVDTVLIAALATAWLHGRYAVAAVLVYRFISLKVLITAVSLTYHYVAGCHRDHAAKSPTLSPNPLKNLSLASNRVRWRT
jgi:Lysylphosphatidylglycerol synthase TM region